MLMSRCRLPTKGLRRRPERFDADVDDVDAFPDVAVVAVVAAPVTAAGPAGEGEGVATCEGS